MGKGKGKGNGKGNGKDKGKGTGKGKGSKPKPNKPSCPSADDMFQMFSEKYSGEWTVNYFYTKFEMCVVKMEEGTMKYLDK